MSLSEDLLQLLPTELSEMPVDALEERLQVDEQGLSSAEAAVRLQEFGPNEIAEKKRNQLLIALGYFWAPIPWMIEVALVLSLVVQHWTDAVIIAVLLVMNGVVAFVEEHQAAGAIAALKERLATSARARRDGSWVTVPVQALVPGDVIRLRLGDVVPADARIFGNASLEVDQSALTGESLPVSCAHGDVLYSGAVITRGEADALVYATGANSFFGKTTALVQEAGTVSHFQQAVLRIGHFLILGAVVLVAITTAVSLLRGNAVLQTLEFALVLTIASVPVALPAVLSVTMAVGARQLAHRKAVVSHLPAVEELGGIDVLCSDKTGTLTQNHLAVAQQWTSPGFTQTDVLLAACLASRSEDKDPIDDAVLTAGSFQVAVDVQVTDFVPFDPVTKRTEATVVQQDGTRYQVSKGAPQAIAERCGEDPATRSMDTQVNEFADKGYRSLAVARSTVDGRWQLLGLLALADPPRDDSAPTVAAAQQLGTRVKMVTGDQVAIGVQIARQVGIGEHIVSASALEDGQDGDSLADLAENADGFAQVFPEHKYRIVQLLQQRRHIVGMTGDGVNDAPALKQADAGIAVAGATDAARAAADVVLTAPGLSVIVEAIRLAREIFARMTSYAMYRIAETIRVLLLVSFAIMVFNFFPVTATMIVLLAVLNDGAILAIAYDHVRGSPKPASWDMRRVLSVSSALGVLGVLETFLLFALAHRVFHLDTDLIRTLIYLKLSVSGHLTVFVTRTHGPFWRKPAPSRLLLGAVIGTQVTATLIAVFGFLMTPLGWGLAALVWGYSIFWFLVEDRVKLGAYSVLERRARPAAASPAS